MLFRLLETYGWLGTILLDWFTRFWGWATHDASGFFTMLLTGIAVFQLGLFYRQLSLMRGSLAEAKSATLAATEAATAAKLNAEAVINAERAYLWPGFPTCSPQPDGNSVLWHISLLNTGRTPGMVKSIHYALLTEPDFNTGLVTHTKYDGMHDVVLPNTPGSERRTGLSQLVVGEPKISCGYVVYSDIFGNTHKQGWKHRLHHDSRESEPLPGCYSDPVDTNH
jgi:hypothetical protein